MSLYSGKQIHSYHWKELPICEEVIKRVEELATKENQPLLVDNHPIFEWSSGQPIDTPNEETQQDDVTTNEQDEIIEDEDIKDETPQEDFSIADDNTIEDTENIDDEVCTIIDDINKDVEQMDDEINTVIDDINNSNYDEDNDEKDENDISDDLENENVILDDIDEGLELRRSSRENAGTGVTRLEPTVTGPSHDNKKNQFLMRQLKSACPKTHEFDIEAGYNLALKAVFAQMPAAKGFKLFGEQAVAAMVKELKQLEHGPMPGKKVIGAINPDDLSDEQKRAALNAVNLIKKKIDGSIKGRTCADGSKQHKYLKEDESIASPKVALESLITTLVIDVFEHRNVVTFEIPGAYLHAEMPTDKTLLLKLKGTFVDMICSINEEYEQYVRYENGKKGFIP